MSILDKIIQIINNTKFLAMSPEKQKKALQQYLDEMKPEGAARGFFDELPQEREHKDTSELLSAEETKKQLDEVNLSVAEGTRLTAEQIDALHMPGEYGQGKGHLAQARRARGKGSNFFDR
jgi:hypothetical protein